MKHRLAGKKLGRDTNQRRSLVENLIKSLFKTGYIKTTQAKSVAILPLAEKYCRFALKADLSSRRKLYTILQDRHFVSSFQKSIVETFPNHKQSFFKTQKLKRRLGDDALIVKISFTKPFTLAKKEVIAKTIKSPSKNDKTPK